MLLLNATRFTDGVFATLPEIRAVYSGELWANWPENNEANPDNMPVDQDFEYIFLDIEHWKHWRINPDGTKTLHSHTGHQNINRYVGTMQDARNKNPLVQKFGYYSRPGIGKNDFNGVDRKNDFRAWISFYQRVIDCQDYIAPSFYVHDNETAEDWYEWADECVAFLREFTDKPIIPFIWWNRTGSQEYIGDNYLYMVLDYCKENTDGAILWTGSQDSYDESVGYHSIIEQFA